MLIPRLKFVSLCAISPDGAPLGRVHPRQILRVHPRQTHSHSPKLFDDARTRDDNMHHTGDIPDDPPYSRLSQQKAVYHHCPNGQKTPLGGSTQG
jgi:hypothetical protein